MDHAALVGFDLQLGEKIVSALEAAGLRIAVAMWVHFPEYESWRFVLSSKDLDPFSRSDAYLKIDRILVKAGVQPSDIPLTFIIKTTDPFIRTARRAFGKSSSVKGMRLGGQQWGNRYVEDAFAYKIA